MLRNVQLGSQQMMVTYFYCEIEQDILLIRLRLTINLFNIQHETLVYSSWIQQRSCKLSKILQDPILQASNQIKQDIWVIHSVYATFQFFHLQSKNQMYREYTPVQDKYKTAKWGVQNDKSLTYSNAQKSYSAYKSTEMGSKSPYKSMAVSRLEDARKTIDEVIVDLSQKRDMNDEAIRQIRDVHSQIIEDYRKNHPFQSKTNLVRNHPAEYKSANASTYDLRSVAVPDQSLILRQRLNQELKRNNQILLRLSQVEQENKQIKRQYQMSFGPNAETEQLRVQNQRLRARLSQLSNIPQQIFGQIEELKRQNQLLRGDTVRLLRKIQKF